MRQYFYTAAVVASGLCLNQQAEAAVYLKTFNVSSVLKEPSKDASTPTLKFYGQVKLAAPAFKSSLGVLQSVTIYFDFVRSTLATVNRTPTAAQSADEYRIFYNNFVSVDDEFLVGFADFAYFDVAKGTTKASSAAPVSFSDSYKISANSSTYANLLKSGLTVDSGSNLTITDADQSLPLPPGITLGLKSRGNVTVSLLYEYTPTPAGAGVAGFNALAAVPEPASWGLMIAGVATIGGAMRRRSVRPALA